MNTSQTKSAINSLHDYICSKGGLHGIPMLAVMGCSLWKEWTEKQHLEWKSALETGTFPNSILYVNKKTAQRFVNGWAKRVKEIRKDGTKAVLRWRLKSAQFNGRTIASKLP